MMSLRHGVVASISAVFAVVCQPVPAIAGADAYDIDLLLGKQNAFAGSVGNPPAAGGTTTPASANDALAQRENDALREPDAGLTKESKAVILNSAAVAAVATYGILQWDYFQTSPKATPEGWFGRTTKSGGADKVGHLWSTYATSHLLSYVYRQWGYSDSAANGLGALSALGIQTMMEIGDAYSSDFGFSYEDFVMNVAGAGTAYVLGKYPALKNKIDLRVEYRPDSFGDIAGDVFTDYDNQRYLMALKLDGFDVFEDSYLGYLELHFGYFTRGYEGFRSDRPDNRERSVYVGVGVNVTKPVRKFWNPDLAVFNYIQIPYTSVRKDIGLD